MNIRFRRSYTPAEVNETLGALQQNIEVHLSEAQAMSIIKSLFVLGFRVVNVGKIENEPERVRRAQTRR